MHILVTGDKGYIGAVMVPMLLREGHTVAGLDCDWFEDSAFSDLLSEAPSKKKDLRDVQSSDLVGFDAVIHLAALSNDPLSDLNPELTYEINHAASVRLAKLAKENGVKRFLFSSSCSTYGAAGGEALLNEEAELRPVTPYGRSKVLVEQDLLKLADSSFSPTFLRNATAYGLSPRLRFDLVLNNLVAWGITTGRIYIKSDGTPWRPIVHVEDICRAFVAVLDAPRELVHCEAFNIGSSEENYQIRDLAQIVNDIVPGCRVEYAKDGGPDKRCYRVDFSKVAKMLPGFKPQWNARKGARQVYDAIQQLGLRVEDFEGPKYQRIAHLQQLISRGCLDATLRWRENVRMDEGHLQIAPEIG
jgi:nucleoside-diphosphate-sugar epimerase